MLERTIWRILLFFGFSYVYTVFLYGSLLLVANDPCPPIVVKNPLSETYCNIDPIFILRNVCNSVFSRKRTSHKNITFLVSSMVYETPITGFSDKEKRASSSLKITRHVDPFTLKPTFLHSNANRNRSVTIFSKSFTLPTKAVSVSSKNSYSRKRRSSLFRSSQNRAKPTTAVEWTEGKSDNVPVSDSNFTESYGILTNSVPTNISTIIPRSFEIGSSFVIISRILPYESSWFTELYRYKREDWFVCLH